MTASPAAGYSGTPLVRKLGIGPASAVALLAAPDDLDGWLGELPAGVTVRTAARGRLDVVLLFVTRRADLERRLAPAVRSIFPDGGLWVAWPKRSSGVATDVTEDTVRAVGLPVGLVDNKVCAVTDVWSGLRLVWRREHRAGSCPI